MNIRYKNYEITKDEHNYIVNKVSVVTAEKGKAENVGNEYLKPLKYHRTLKNALNSVRDLLIADKLDDVEKINDIVRKIESCDKDFEDYLDGAY